MVGTLRDNTQGPQIPRAERSPAWDVLNSFSISEFQIFEIFKYWETEATPRDALCRWASENMEYLESFVPNTYPRTVTQASYSSALFYITTILGSLTVVLVGVTAFLVQRRKKKRAIRYAQISFLRLLLVGCFFVAIGAIVAGIPPTNVLCICKVWFVDIGYTLQIVPLIVKTTAIHQMMLSAQRMRRTKIRMHHLLLSVAIITCLMVIFLILWTVLDPPTKTGEYRLTDTNAEDGSLIVDVNYYCNSNSSAWGFLTVGWDVFLLLVASVLAVQTRNIRQDFNESRTLAFLIYSHAVFVLLRMATYFLDNSGILKSTLTGVRSILYSTDTIAGICIYFIPKLIISHGPGDSSYGTRTTSSQLPSLSQSRENTQSRRNSASTAFEEVVEDTHQEAHGKNAIDNDETVRATNGKVPMVPQHEQPQVRCRRCGYLDGEEENLLEEAKVQDVTVEEEEEKVH